jgi:uncharacterized membrane-anchored protein
MRKLLVWLGLLVILIVTNFVIVSKERILAQGDVLLLDMAPRDPRSLMQGDYMTLRYRIAQEIENAATKNRHDGYAVVKPDDKRVAQFVRLYVEGSSLAADERLLRYRNRAERVKVATDAYFFQEGRGHFYAAARYGKFRVSKNGEVVLVGLCDANLRALTTDAVNPAQQPACLDQK